VVERHELRALIAIRSTSAKSFARRVGISPAELSLIVHGRCEPNRAKALRIETALGRPAGSLFPPEAR
jgi:transcriptional regulator with XRE-family HTH domain